MTVSELIDVLKNYDDDAKVYIAIGRNTYDTSVAIRLSKLHWEVVSNDVVIVGVDKLIGVCNTIDEATASIYADSELEYVEAEEVK